MEQQYAPEFSRVLMLEKVGQFAYTFNIEAKEQERVLLAQRFNIPRIDLLKAKFVINRGSTTGEYNVDGFVTADVTQSCVVSLEDVSAHLEFPIHLLLRRGCEEDFADDIEANFEDSHVDLDFYQDFEIDLGEICAQYLSLALDPYPRLNDPQEQEPAEEVEKEKLDKKVNPFIVLEKLRKSS
jgi:uncharacterized metal-binding protein YceD (DUF177 family)